LSIDNVNTQNSIAFIYCPSYYAAERDGAMIIACVGARFLDARQLHICRSIGKVVAEQGGQVSTGAAPGADQAYAEGCLAAGGSVQLWLPWSGFESKWVKSMKERYDLNVTAIALSHIDLNLQKKAYASIRMLPYGISKDAVRKLMARNYIIVEAAQKTIGWPGGADKNGGTRQAMRCADSLSRPVLDLYGKKVTRRLIEEFLAA